MIVSDPVFGFVEVPEGLLSRVVRHPYVVRLSRLKQLGTDHYVYPGAMHTRFQHSVGALHLVTEALVSLSEKGVLILEEEWQGVQTAMLLHDVGHGPFSHVLERAFLPDFSHEELSLILLRRMNDEMDGRLSVAERILSDTYPRHFLHELVCSQLDMDRLDYLCRDSFFTGVREGNIGVARIIKMLGVADDRLTVEEKGVYTIENYLMARRLMYWQVYLHKTSLAAQVLLRSAVDRARQLAVAGVELFATPDLLYFLKNNVTKSFAANHPEWLEHFVRLDDAALETSLMQWTQHADKVLSLLARNYVDRQLFKVQELRAPMPKEELDELRRKMAVVLNLTEKDAAYFVQTMEINQMLYSTKDDHISILLKDGSTCDISDFSELLSSELADKLTRRYYLFTQRQ